MRTDAGASARGAADICRAKTNGNRLWIEGIGRRCARWGVRNSRRRRASMHLERVKGLHSIVRALL